MRKHPRDFWEVSVIIVTGGGSLNSRKERREKEGRKEGTCGPTLSISHLWITQIAPRFHANRAVSVAMP